MCDWWHHIFDQLIKRTNSSHRLFVFSRTRCDCDDWLHTWYIQKGIQWTITTASNIAICRTRTCLIRFKFINCLQGIYGPRAPRRGASSDNLYCGGLKRMGGSICRSRSWSHMWANLLLLVWWLSILLNFVLLFFFWSSQLSHLTFCFMVYAATNRR